MDNPNVTVRRCRRHNSLPGSSTGGSSSFLLRMSHKSNPYVGTFRHSPPTSRFPQIFGQDEQKLEKSKNAALFFAENSFSSLLLRHNSPLSRTLPDALYRILVLGDTYNELLPGKCSNGLFRLDHLLNGHLRGGYGPSGDIGEWSRTLLRQSTENSSSGTVQVLSRLAQWLLLPFQDPDTSKYSHEYLDETSTLTDVSLRTEDDDDVSSIFSHHDASHSYGSSSVLSSQAEAYYAHQALSSSAKDLLVAPGEPATGQDYRLDYTITQMDVIRMMRNASRHLDVESICQLPVYTYQKGSQQPPRNLEREVRSEDKEEGDMSWLLVRSEDADGGEVVADGQHGPSPDKTDDHDVCVICLEHFCPGDRLRVLPCVSAFGRFLPVADSENSDRKYHI